MYPRDAIRIDFDNPNPNTVLLATGTRTYLGASIECDATGNDIHLQFGTVGSNYLLDKEIIQTNSSTNFPIATSTPLRYTESVISNCYVSIVYVNRDRSVTPDPYSEYSTSTPVSGNLSISNFPTGFNVNNFPALQAVSVNNFPTLQDVNCTIGCNASTTLILSSSTIQVLTTTAPTFQEWMLVVGVFLAINSIHMWNFLFGKPRIIK
jgi:hypothetical protein